MEKPKKCSCGNDEDGLLERLEEIIKSYKDTQGALIPVLQATQSLFGYIPQEAILKISEILNEPLSKVYGVITFYSFFSLKPRGKYLIRVCLGTACYVQGATELLTALKQQLSIEIGETTPDKLFTLDVGRCFGACGLAPIIMVNDDVHQWVKPSGVKKILSAYQNKKEVKQGEIK
ncbi:MAG: NADH:ubiquinone oxidoreductase [Bacteroidetes bacterium RIFCSPLOWO2_12_FULL_31_6]|nr:MAG: NADH:ubiquinone oxidoreductase [Bacteroidetes bacterium RIFCSPLOWO2_12_FULL_31_6]